MDEPKSDKKDLLHTAVELSDATDDVLDNEKTVVTPPLNQNLEFLDLQQASETNGPAAFALQDLTIDPVLELLDLQPTRSTVALEKDLEIGEQTSLDKDLPAEEELEKTQKITIAPLAKDLADPDIAAAAAVTAQLSETPQPEKQESLPWSDPPSTLKNTNSATTAAVLLLEKKEIQSPSTLSTKQSLQGFLQNIAASARQKRLLLAFLSSCLLALFYFFYSNAPTVQTPSSSHVAVVKTVGPNNSASNATAKPQHPNQTLNVAASAIPTLQWDTIQTADHLTLKQGINHNNNAIQTWAYLRLAWRFHDDNAKLALQGILKKNIPPSGDAIARSAYAAALALLSPERSNFALGLLNDIHEEADLIELSRCLIKQQSLGVAKVANDWLNLAKRQPTWVDPQAFVNVSAWLNTAANRRDSLLQESHQLLKDANSFQQQPLAYEALAEVLNQLYQQNRYEDLAIILEYSQSMIDANMDKLSPYARGILLNMASKVLLLQGQDHLALQLSEKRARQQPDDLQALLQWSHLAEEQTASGQLILQERMNAYLQEKEKFSQKSQKEEAEITASKILYHEVLLALLKQQPDLAEQALKNNHYWLHPEAHGWSKLAQGRYYLFMQQPQKAKEAFDDVAKKTELIGYAHWMALSKVPFYLDMALSTIYDNIHTDETLELRYLEALAWQWKEEHSKAAALFETILWTTPSIAIHSFELRTLWRQELARSGNSQQAIRQWQRQIHQTENKAKAIAALANLLNELQLHQAEIQWRRLLVHQQPNQPLYQLQLADALVDNNQTEEALKILEKVSQNSNTIDGSALLYSKAHAALKTDAILAHTMLKNAVFTKPHPQAYLLLAQISEQRRQLSEAIEYYENYLNLEPQHPALRLRLLQLKLQAGQEQQVYKELWQHYQQGLLSVPFLVLLGDLQKERKEAKQALNSYTQALALQGNDLPLILKIAKLQLNELNNLPQALIHFQKANQLDPKQAEIYYHLGFVAKDLGKIKEAKKAFKVYLKLWPKGEFSKEIRQTLRSLKALR